MDFRQTTAQGRSKRGHRRLLQSTDPTNKNDRLLDIMTYDDLLRRLENIIVMMKREVSDGSAK